jgi:hypothetical protein
MAHIFYEYLPEKLKPITRFKSSSQLYFDVPQRMERLGRKGLKSSMRTVSCTDKAGLGTGQHFIHFCVHPDTLLTDGRKISDVGEPTLINYSGDTIKIRVWNTPRFLEVTPDHKILTGTGMVQAKDITKNDLIVQKIPQILGDREYIEYDWNRYYPGKHVHDVERVKLLADKDLGFIIGLFLAEGSIGASKISFGLNIKETHLIDKICNYFPRTSIRYMNGNGVEVYATGQKWVELVKLFLKDGKNGNKIIPEWIYNMPRDFILSMICGFFTGDGWCVEKHGRVSIKQSHNLNILIVLRNIIASLGIGWGNICECKNNTYTYSICGLPAKELAFQIWNKDIHVNYENPSRKNNRCFIIGNNVYQRIHTIDNGYVNGVTFYDLFNQPDHEYSTIHGIISNSEYAFYRDADKVRTAVIPTAFKTPGTFIVIESTANGMVGQGEPFYKEWMRAKENKSAFVPLFFSWLQHEDYMLDLLPRDEEEIRDTIDDEEKYLVKVHSASFEQLKWRREQIKMLGHGEGIGDKTSIENFHEQYPTTDEEAFVVSGNPVFDRVALRAYKERVKKPIMHGEIIGDKFETSVIGNIHIWDLPIEKEKYVLSIDPSSGEPGETDFGAIEIFRVLNRHDGGFIAEQCAEWHGKEDTDTIARYAVILARMYNNAVIAPEVFGYGHAVLKEIQKMDYWNIFQRRTIDTITMKPTKKLGWKTDSSTKPMIVSYARQCISKRNVILKSERLVDELIIYVRDQAGTGTSGYGRGKDDLVDAFMINMFVMDIVYRNYNGSLGVMEQKKDTQIQKKDKLHYDNFNPRKNSEHKHWLEL